MPRKTKETKDLAPALPVSKELLDQLVTGPMTPEQFENMFRGLKKAVLEHALGAELTHHLGAEKDQGAQRGNHRNGTTPKTVITDDGAVRLEVPRDRPGTSEPQLIGKHERRFEGFGYVEGITHDYVRHGTTTLFAALDIANGSVLTQCKPQHRHQEFLSFLRHIEANAPPRLDVHMICDNYATHTHPRVRSWPARRPRFHLHFTPTYSSWLNQVERWFALITNQSIRRGSFQSVSDLKRQINTFVDNYNQHPKPFKWAATADSILAKLERLCKVINGTQH